MDLIIYGSGGHGAVVLDAALARGQRLLGFVDDHAPVGAVVLGFPVLGGEAWLAAHGPARVALGIGSNAVRRRIWERCRLLRLEVVTIVHPRACVSTFAELGVGAVVLAGAVINARARVGLGAIVNSGAVVEHDVALGDFSHVSPNATLAGAAALGVE
ncbi:MAG TPA: hypothetical protein VER33_03475, partial [Polyangiaceae bacterium]|nr:hypothetical protein [Polyangiaceae bacterium]